MNDYSGLGNEYKKNSIETASPVRLVVMLYEGAIRFIDEAQENMNYVTYDKVNYNISRAKDIVVELQTSLNFENGGEISDRLNALYLFVLDKLRKANVEKQTQPLIEAREVMASLLTAWRDVEKTGGNGLSSTQLDNGEGDLPLDDLENGSGFSVEG